MENNSTNNSVRSNLATQSNQQTDPTSVADIDNIIQNGNNNVPRTTVSAQDITQLTSMFSQMTASNRNRG